MNDGSCDFQILTVGISTRNLTVYDYTSWSRRARDTLRRIIAERRAFRKDVCPISRGSEIIIGWYLFPPLCEPSWRRIKELLGN